MRTPWHLWLIGVLTLIWNIGGAFNYLAIKLPITSVTSQMTEPQLAFFANAPLWYAVAWALGVWCSVLGSMLLLARSRAAGSVLALSLLGLLAGSYYSFVAAEVSLLAGATPFERGLTAAIFVVLVLTLIYARAMTRRGVLA